MTTLIVFSSCPDLAQAEALASALVDQRLAACVQLVPGVRSFYRWQGAVERSDEVQIVIKTSSDRLPALQQALLALHPYELPELVAVEAAAGLDRYLDWIGASTRPVATA